MAEPNLVPRTNKGASIGTALKQWANGFFGDVTIDGNKPLVDANNLGDVADPAAALENLGGVPKDATYRDLLAQLAPSAENGIQLLGHNYMHPALTFSRASAATRTSFGGRLVESAIDDLRLDYTDGEPGWRLEGERTNLLLWSEDYSQAVWSKFEATAYPAAVVAPGGALATTVETEATTGGFGNVNQVFEADGKQLTATVWLHPGSLDQVTIALRDVASNDWHPSSCQVISGSADVALRVSGRWDITNISGWVRVSITTDAAIGNGVMSSFYVYPGAAGSGTPPGSIVMWGAQVESGSAATSYIRTEDATVTRAGDNLSLTGEAFEELWNPQEGTIVLDLDSSVATLSQQTIFFAGADDSIADCLRIVAWGDGAEEIRFQVRSGGSSVFIGGRTGIPAGKRVIAFAMEPGNSAGYISGQTPLYFGNDFDVTPTRLSIGSQMGTVPHPGLYRVRYYPRRLSDAELQALTTL